MTAHMPALSIARKDKSGFDPQQMPSEQDNSFLQAADVLFSLAARIKQFSSEMDPLTLQNYLIPNLQQMETVLQQKNIRAEKILLAKYFMCCFLDDLIEQVWLKNQGLWRAYRLVFYFFQENDSDERFFALLERLQQEPSSNIDLLELAYIIFLHDYQGAYRKAPNGYYLALEKIDELYQILHWQHGDFRKNLFISA